MPVTFDDIIHVAIDDRRTLEHGLEGLRFYRAEDPQWDKPTRTRTGVIKDYVLSPEVYHIN